MNQSPKARLAAACRRLLRPLVRILLRNGLAYGDFAEVVKRVYSDVARDDLAQLGGRVTDSRVAIVTGLTRKEVKRLRELPDEAYAGVSWGGANRATRVLSGWHRDPDFTDESGVPKDLSMKDDAGFPALVRRYSGDIPVTAMLEELEQVAAVRRMRSGKVRVLKRAYVPEAGAAEGVRMLGSATHDLLATIDYNLSREPEQQPYFQRVVFDNRLDRAALPLFRRLSAEHSQKLLELLDDWLDSHAVSKEEEAQGRGVRAGVGVYFFQDPEGEPGDSEGDDDG